MSDPARVVPGRPPGLRPYDRVTFELSNSRMGTRRREYIPKHYTRDGVRRHVCAQRLECRAGGRDLNT